MSFPVTLAEFTGHAAIASFLKCDFLYILQYNISTELARHTVPLFI